MDNVLLQLNRKHVNQHYFIQCSGFEWVLKTFARNNFDRKTLFGEKRSSI